MPPSERKSLMEMAGPSTGKTTAGGKARSPEAKAGRSDDPKLNSRTTRMVVLGVVIAVLAGIAMWTWRTPEPQLTPEEEQALQAPPEEIPAQTNPNPADPSGPPPEPPSLE